MEKKKEKPTGRAPFVPTEEVPDPSVPNRAHTEMMLGNFGADKPQDAGNTLGNFDTNRAK